MLERGTAQNEVLVGAMPLAAYKEAGLSFRLRLLGYCDSFVHFPAPCVGLSDLDAIRKIKCGAGGTEDDLHTCWMARTSMPENVVSGITDIVMGRNVL